ncbi:viral A-type inclusion protein [Reticulomyxa filosa]|uniref:Viral A-type inclusion protein n=1 Tax=Reticulomyxa filosa TaxID=46433 RepID=X6LE41_RETFI|nr:viral A-type inclusion protein [Reticulomyxa filosa]|eukprot:ETN99361.1 viral A-type inclusion protein [Reticulomyxa filosa]
MIALRLNETQLNNLLQWLIKGYKDKDEQLQNSCLKILQIISKNLSKQQVDDIFEFLLSGINDKYEKVRASCAKGLEMIASRLNETKLDHLLNWSKNNFEDTNCWVRSLCRQIFGIMFTQLNEQQRDDLFEFLSDGLNNKSGDILQSYADTLQKIVLQLNTTQLNKLLLNKLNTMNNEVEIEKPLSESNELDPDGFFMRRTKNKDYDSYIHALRKTVLQLDEIKLDEVLPFFKKRLYRGIGHAYISYMKIFETILSGLNERQMGSLIKKLKNQYNKILLKRDKNGSVFDLYMKGLPEKALNLDGTLLYNLLQEGFNHTDDYVRDSYSELLKSIASKLNEQQTRSIFELLLKGLNNKYTNICCSCAKILREMVSKLSRTQLYNLLSMLKEKFDDKDYEVQYLCVKILKKISSELTDQLDDVLQCLKNGFNYGDDSIHNSCAKILQRISPKLNNEQLSNMLQCLSDRFKLYDGNLQNSSQKILQIIITKLKKRPLDETVKYLEYGSKDYDIQSWILYTKIMSSISTELNKQQLDITFKFLSEIHYIGIDDRDLRIKTLEMIAFESDEVQLNNLLYYFQNKLNTKSYIIGDPYEQMLEIVLSKLNERQIDNTFKIWMDEYNNIIYRVCNSYAAVLITKLNDEQLCLLINNVLKDTVSGFVLSEISDDMWRRITITTLKKNTKIKMGKKNFEMESLASGLLACNPRIQFNHNDNNDNIINSEAFKELIDCCNKQAMKWGFSIQQKWRDYNTSQTKLQSQQSNSYIYKGLYASIHEAAKLGDISKLKSSLERHRIDINGAFNELGQTPLHVAIHNKRWDIARYCIEQGAWVDVGEGGLDANTSQAPCEYISKLIENIEKEEKKNEDEEKKIKENKKKKKEYVEMCKWILRKRVTYPMKQIEYAIDYAKDKLINKDGIIKVIDEDSYQTLLMEGASFLLGMNQKELKEILINDNLLYWAAGRNVKSVIGENSIQSEFNKGWLSSTFQRYKIFLLFEICIRLKLTEGCYELPKYTTCEQMYEKGLKELQVQLTIYWDYNTAMNICNNLLDDWSSNVVDRLISPRKEYYEMSLVVGHKGHCFYLSLCKASNYVLVRIDNRLMDTVPSNTPHRRNKHKWIQPYLVAYFPCNSENINKNKEWLKNYIKNAFALRNKESDESMKYLYCSDIQSLDDAPPREGESPSIAENWPYRPVQTDAENCYMRGHNVGYRIRLGDNLYRWFRDQEGKSFVFHRSHHSIGMNKQKKGQESLQRSQNQFQWNLESFLHFTLQTTIAFLLFYFVCGFILFIFILRFLKS